MEDDDCSHIYGNNFLKDNESVVDDKYLSDLLDFADNDVFLSSNLNIGSLLPLFTQEGISSDLLPTATPEPEVPREETSSVQHLLTGEGLPICSPSAQSVSSETSSFAFADIPDSTTAINRKTSDQAAPKKGRRRQYSKDSEEYRARRDRNNVAVRKSRDKAKQKQKETEGVVAHLRQENSQLKKRLETVTHQLGFLRSLLAQAQIKVAPDVEKYLQRLTNGAQ